MNSKCGCSRNSSSTSSRRDNGNGRKRFLNDYNRRIQGPSRSSTSSRRCYTAKLQGPKSRGPGSHSAVNGACLSQERRKMQQQKITSQPAIACNSTAVADTAREIQEIKSLPQVQGKCCTCQKPILNKCRPICVPKYVQPEKRESCAPERTYRKPLARMDDDTVYKMSYPGVDPELAAECRREMMKAEDNITSRGKFSSDTTQKHDYRKWPDAPRPNIIMPEKHRFLGEGPMSSKTSYIHDYPAKMAPKPEPFVPTPNFRLSNKCMEDTSTMNASYQPIHKYDPVHSYKPQRYYEKPSMPLESETVNKLSYMPWPMPEKEDFPWASRGEYRKPFIPMEGNTIYNNSYVPSCEDARRNPIKYFDSGDIICEGRHFEDRTIYKESYLPVEDDIRPKLIPASDHLTTGKAKFANQTTQKHDYQGWPGVPPANIIMPEKHRFLGEGPMSSNTSYNHDYLPKNAPIPEPFVPTPSLRLSNRRMEDTSTMNASYQPFHKYDPVHSYKPQRYYEKPSMPLESETVNKLSYMPWPMPEKEDLPWASRGEYRKPFIPMDANTIYNNSYIAPGTYDCDFCCCPC